MKLWKLLSSPVVIAAMLVAVMAPASAVAVHRARDVSPANVHADAIDWIIASGISRGCDVNGNYCPSEAVTRAQLATILERFAANGEISVGGLSIEEVAGGLPGAVGPAGPAGPAGPVGPAGEPGAAGPQGVPGADGSDGAVGPQGPKGEAGPVGPRGPQGAPGVDGVDGEDGKDGLDGAVGPQGATGPQGPQGEVGPAGPQGEVGPAGPQGEVGPAGPQGESGLTQEEIAALKQLLVEVRDLCGAGFGPPGLCAHPGLGVGLGKKP